MAFIPIDTYQHQGPMQQFHTRPGSSSSVFANDIFSEYPFASITGARQTNNDYNSYNSTGPVVRNIKIQLEGEESEEENEIKVQVSETVNKKCENKENVIETQCSESNKISSNENLPSLSQPILGKRRKAVLLDLWGMNKVSIQIRNWLVKSDFEVTPIIGNYQKGVSCGYIAAQAACILRKLFTKEIEDEPLRQLILSKCLDPDLIKKVNNVLEIDNKEAISLDMVQIYEVILSLMGGSDDLSWLTVTTWDAFLEGMREGHQSNEFSVWIVNTADTESSLQEGYNDQGDHWFTVVIWP